MRCFLNSHVRWPRNSGTVTSIGGDQCLLQVGDVDSSSAADFEDFEEALSCGLFLILSFSDF